MMMIYILLCDKLARWRHWDPVCIGSSQQMLGEFTACVSMKPDSMLLVEIRVS